MNTLQVVKYNTTTPKQEQITDRQQITQSKKPHRDKHIHSMIIMHSSQISNVIRQGQQLIHKQENN